MTRPWIGLLVASFVTVAACAAQGPVGEDGAYVKVVEGRYHVCPWRTTLRVLAGMLSFREAAVFDDPSMFVTDASARRATRDLRRLRRHARVR